MPVYYEYYDINVPSVNSKFLARDHSNTLLRELQMVPGSANNPSGCKQTDEKTGFYWPSEGVWALSSLGWAMFSFTNGSFSYIDRFGNKLNLLNDPLTTDVNIHIPSSPGTLGLREDNYVEKTNSEGSATIYPGMLVRLYSTSGCKLANATSDADFAIGMARTTSAPTDNTIIQLFGKLTLADWTAITGTATLSAGLTYYLSATSSGQMTTTSPIKPQIIGIALSATEFFIKVA